VGWMSWVQSACPHKTAAEAKAEAEALAAEAKAEAARISAEATAAAEAAAAASAAAAAAAAAAVARAAAEAKVAAEAAAAEAKAFVEKADAEANRMMEEAEARARADGKLAVFRTNPRIVEPHADSCGTTPEEPHLQLHDVVTHLRGRGRKILSIEYIVNPKLEEAYELKRREMIAARGRGIEGSGGGGADNERFLFHGTSVANSKAITRENFRLDKVRRWVDWCEALWDTS